MKSFLALFFTLLSYSILAQTPVDQQPVIIGAERINSFLPFLKGKNVAVFANQTSTIAGKHLVDTLLSSGVQVVKIFGPEHGFRGTAGAGEKVKSDKDEKTGLPIVSLYGNHKKPGKDDLKDVDIILFDIQDVGVRFYTYISSLQYVMEAAFEHNKQLWVLDRPNPNGFYVDGPVLKKGFESFVGMQPIPVVYGMTIGEYSQMILAEGWIKSAKNKKYHSTVFSGRNHDADMVIVPLLNYDHHTKYDLPVAPSPNLKNMQSIYLYPSTCFFEGTVLSEGRGTDYPFQIFGHPSLPKNLYHFVPKPNAGAKSSKCFYQNCYGWFVDSSASGTLTLLGNKLNLQFLLDAYRLFPGKDSFFLSNNFFNKLAGNDVLMKQIKAGLTEDEIRLSWQEDLEAFKRIRRKYLLYPDFE